MSLTCCIAFAILLASTLGAQSPGGRGQLLATKSGNTIGDNFGQDCALLGDLNGDGFSEWLVGAPRANDTQFIQAGSAYVYSGVDGSVLYEYFGTVAAQNYGSVVASFGDLDADGAPDFGVTSLLDSTVYAYSGATGQQLFSVSGPTGSRFGWSLAAGGDLNADGRDDILVGAYFANNGVGKEGSVFAFSGVDGSQLLRIDGQAVDGQLGFAIAGFGDQNSDGVPDILASSFLESTTVQRAGVIRIFSGVDGSELLRIEGREAGAGMGSAISTLADINSDQIPEILSGTIGADPNGLEQAGSVFVHSGATGALIYRLDGIEFEQAFGTSCADCGDLSGDGYADFAVGSLRASNGAGIPDTGRVDFFSGREGRLVYSIYGESPFDGFGRGLDGGEDINGDGLPDILVSAPQDFLFLAQEGVAYAFSYESFIQIDRARLSITVGGTTSIELSFPPSEAGKRYGLLASERGNGITRLGGLNIPLQRDLLFDLMLAGNAPPAFQSAVGQLDAQGCATAKIAIPSNSPAELIGITVSLAAVSFGVAKPRMSSGSVFVKFRL